MCNVSLLDDPQEIIFLFLICKVSKADVCSLLGFFSKLLSSVLAK